MTDVDTAAIRAKYTDPQIGSQKMVRVLCDALDAARAEARIAAALDELDDCGCIRQWRCSACRVRRALTRDTE